MGILEKALGYRTPEETFDHELNLVYADTIGGLTEPSLPLAMELSVRKTCSLLNQKIDGLYDA